MLYEVITCGPAIISVPGGWHAASRRGQYGSTPTSSCPLPLRSAVSRTVLFLPYRHGRSMGEEIEPFANQLVDEDWLLLSHGDWSGGLRKPNPHEPGIYMPLTRKDIELYKPSCIVLGHIHIPMDLPPIHYPGSPCGLDITESGKRRYSYNFV